MVGNWSKNNSMFTIFCNISYSEGMFEFLSQFHSGCSTCHFRFSGWKEILLTSSLLISPSESANVPQFESEVDSSVHSVLSAVQKVMTTLNSTETVIITGTSCNDCYNCYNCNGSVSNSPCYVLIVLPDESDPHGIKFLHTFTTQILHDLHCNLVGSINAIVLAM